MASSKDKVAVVTGASRGAGRGIALVLGESGMIVYVTGRSVRGGPTADGMPGTIDETAEAVSARGGNGIAIRCDHTDDAQVESLFTRVREEQGRLDLLVNNAWGGYEQQPRGLGMEPFWEQPPRHWETMFGAGVRAHLVASRCAVPLMLPGQQGVIVCTTAWDRDKYLGNLYYDLAKNAIARMVFGMAIELRPHNIAALALAPGFIRTERVMAAHAAHPFDLGQTESPEYIGRAVVALAGDPDVLGRSGRVLAVGDLALEFGFTDVDGRRIPPFRIPDPA
jgi:NAD(P)-dependent dehydrogenase (short-subunit alcohol dehydrogenase family)